MLTVKDAEEIINLHKSVVRMRGEISVLDTWKLKSFNGKLTLAQGSDWNAQTQELQFSDGDLGREIIARLIKQKSNKVDEMCRRLRQLNAEVPE